MVIAVNRGFTLIELLITLSVASILLSMAVPSYRIFVQDSLILTQSNSFSTAIMLAKSEAIKTSASATICPSNNGTACTGGTVWSNGWLVFADANGDGAVDAGEQILQVSAPLTGGNTLSGARNRITYSPTGYTFGFADTFSLCDSRGAASSRGIILNNQGRLRTVAGGGTCS